jgi:hypothetical protein
MLSFHGTVEIEKSEESRSIIPIPVTLTPEDPRRQSHSSNSETENECSCKRALHERKGSFFLSVETVWDTKLMRRLIALRDMFFVVGSPETGCRIAEASQKIHSSGNSMVLEFRPLVLTFPKRRRPSR